MSLPALSVQRSLGVSLPNRGAASASSGGVGFDCAAAVFCGSLFGAAYWSELSLSAVAAGGAGAGRDPGGGTFAGGMLPPFWSRKTLFIPPYSPLWIAATGTLALTNFLYWTSSACPKRAARQAHADGFAPAS